MAISDSNTWVILPCGLSARYAERVALRVGQYHPAEVVTEAVAFEFRGAQLDDPGHLVLHVVGVQIEVRLVLAGRRIGHPLEADGRATRSGHQHELTWQRADESTTRTTSLVQRWTETRNILTMASEEARGDEGLLGEKEKAKSEPEGAATPKLPERPRYQTRVIYESED